MTLAPVAAVWTYVQCPFHALTGLDCPLCGSTRALLALLHGDVLSAMRCNILAMAFVMWTAAVLVRRLGGAKAPPCNPAGRGSRRWAVVAALLVFTIGRNLPSAWWLRP